MTPEERLDTIEKIIEENKDFFRQLEKKQQEQQMLKIPKQAVEARPPFAEKALKAAWPLHLVAQGDSWFQYPFNLDVIDWLFWKNLSFTITDNLAELGQTLNEIVHGTEEGVPLLAKLINLIGQKKPQAVLISAGGNDLTLDFYSLLNDAQSGLPNPNPKVMAEVVARYTDMYCELIDVIIAKAAKMKAHIPILVHGYDYPWPNGSYFSFTFYTTVKIGPWFDGAFTKKGFPYKKDSAKAEQQLNIRRKILNAIVDQFNVMMKQLETKYKGTVYYVDLRGSYPKMEDWENELHPKYFAEFANRFFDKLQAVLKQAVPA